MKLYPGVNQLKEEFGERNPAKLENWPNKAKPVIIL